MGLRSVFVVALASIASTGWSFVLMDFNQGGVTELVYGSFGGNTSYTTVNGTALGQAARVAGTSVGGGGILINLPETNISQYLNQRLSLRANVESGNQMVNFTVFFSEANSTFDYHYSFATSSLGQGQFAWSDGLSLNNPSFVLDRSNGFSFVGAGTNFAPSLTRVTTIGIQSNYVFPSQANRIVFDELHIVPEPFTVWSVGMGSLVLARRMRKARS